tara:strand:+ start:12482 stop:13438 length:957 start_codon:yes stop_codon:yes gene_type:complete
MQYYMTYVLGHQTVSGKKAQMGTIVHKVMECLARCKKAIQDNKRTTVDDALGKLKATKKLLYTKDFVNELTDQSYNYYTSNCVHNYTKSDYNTCKKWVWMALDYNNGQFDPRERKIVEPEPHFDIEIDRPWAKVNYTLPNGEEFTGRLAIKGTIDLVTEVDDGVIEVVDWKTGQRKDWATGEQKDYEKLSKDPQLLLYYYAISKLFPQYEQAIMSIFYIRDGGPFSLCFDESDQEYFLDKLRTRFFQIKNNQKPKPISYTQSHWKCQKLCDYAKNDWEDSGVNMCKYVHDMLNKDGIEKTTAECTKKGFNVGYYNAPG